MALFRKRLVGESESIRKIGDLLADYSGSIGKAISLSYGIPWLDRPIQFFLRFLKRATKDVPHPKAELSNKLRAVDQRFVFVIDDIDRLAPDECVILKRINQ